MRIEPLNLLASVLLLASAAPSAQADTTARSWQIRSPDRRCQISVSLSPDGGLRYEAAHDGKTVIQKSALGLRRDDQNFESNLVLAHATKIESRLEKYELLA
ncbi:MAG TPA: glycoside hydrolase family 97 N-terminal domain-containing protein, partial [Candidatus Acidoferrales bacterium]|nr:glycoside hydrolase family 97 N-terminal domain-containing protein [Candidatus Acidoferrales bacterium]